VTSTIAGALTSLGQLPEPGHQVLAAAEVEAGGGLVEQHELRVGHQGPGDLHPLAFSLGQRAVASIGQVLGAQGSSNSSPGRSPAGRSCSFQRPTIP
jgi:hypothetical protein